MSDAQNIERAAQELAQARRVTVLSGAGASAESGVPTFRASDGLWEGHRIEDVATPQGFYRNPQLVWKFYNARRSNVATVQPNPGHYALAELEKRLGEGMTIATQNVDGLHQKAGSKNVLELHGSLRRTRCTFCGEIKDRDLVPLADEPQCEDCQHALRPDIVWFGEGLPTEAWDQAVAASATCDVFLVVGTSAVVYPAAGLIGIARRRAEWTDADRPVTIIEFNLTRTEASDQVDFGLYGPSGQLLPQVLARLNELSPVPS